MHRNQVVIAAFVFLLCTAPTHADESTDDVYSRSGWYAGLGAGVGLANFPENTGTNAAAEFGLLGGYRLTPHIAVESQVYHVHKLDYDRAPYESASFWSILGDVRGYLPLGRVQPFVLAGIGPRFGILRYGGGSDASDSPVDGTVVVGVGVDYYFSESILVSLDGKYNWGFDRDAALDYATIGLRGVYRFK